MRHALLIVVSVMSLVVPSQVMAQTPPFSAIGTGISTIQPLPAPACPPTPWYSWCDSLKSQIAVFNSYVDAYNKVQDLKRQSEQYLRYPQQLQTYVQSDVDQLTSIIGRVQQLSWTDVQADQTVNNTVAQLVNTLPPDQVDAHLNKMMFDSIGNTLLQMHLLGAQDLRDSNTVNQITLAAANAKSPTQVGQMTVAILGILSSQLSRIENVDKAKINAELSQGFSETARLEKERATKEAQDQQTVDQFAPHVHASASPQP